MSDLNLIVVIANKYKEEEIMMVANEAGAHGGTVIHGRGTADPKKMNLLRLTVEPEKEVILIVCSQEKTEAIKQAVKEKLNLEKPNHGILFVVPIKKAIGYMEV
ncbi:MAG: P-II family nitrogen regulator [Bacilli bacterium]|jgi:nitrogen regulatory protein PII|nr:P-II family nitrogen regulator [Acholeplasmataceae bacterium]